MAATVLLRLAAFTGEGRYRDAAERAIGTVAPLMARYPTGFAQWLVAASFAAGDAVEVAVVGDPVERRDAGAARAGLVDVATHSRCSLRRRPRPRATSAVPLLHDRSQVDGEPTAYVCRDFVCQLPVTTTAALIDSSAPVRPRERVGAQDLPRPSSCCDPGAMASRRC